MSQNNCKLSCDHVQKISNEGGLKQDVELCLEVEMDDEVRDIITYPEKCTSTLLDVTVIKPKNMDLYTTQKQTLTSEEVRKLIASIEVEKQDRQRLIDRILTNDKTDHVPTNEGDTKSAGDCSNILKYFSSKVSSTKSKHVHYLNEQESALIFEQMQKMCTTDDTNSERLSSDRTHQIYTSPKTYNDIKSIFTCKNKEYDDCDKLRPCPCQNCAVVGVLTDSQKRPFITENLLDPRELFSRKETREHKKRRYVNFKSENHAECQNYFKHLSEKIRDLEHRLAVQEEKSVPKDYFKRIITKLVSHISKIANYASQEKLSTRPPKFKEFNHKYKEKLSEKYIVHPVIVDQHCKIPAEREFINMRFEDNLHARSYCCSSNQKTENLPEGFWKWGEEILKPGIDLKNKIVLLLEDALQNIKRSRENCAKIPEPSAVPKNYKHYSIGFFNGKTINEVPVRDNPSKNRGHQDQSAANKFTRYTNFTNSGSTVYKQKQPNDVKANEKKVKGYLPRIYSKEEVDLQPVSVSYMNPKLSKWQEESQISFKLDTCDMESLKNSEDKKINECYKVEFRNTISNTKESDKLRLWESIWNQAKINGQTRADKVTIQIPERKNMKNQKIIEIEYTIAELEKLLISPASSYRHDRGSTRQERK